MGELTNEGELKRGRKMHNIFIREENSWLSTTRFLERIEPLSGGREPEAVPPITSTNDRVKLMKSSRLAYRGTRRKPKSAISGGRREWKDDDLV